MTLIFLLLSPALFGLYWIIRFQICVNRRRRLVDTYGLDPKKLRKMSCKEVLKLKKGIDALTEKRDAFGLEALVRPLRP